jgi:nucleolysin TIA-1/TIAR
MSVYVDYACCLFFSLSVSSIFLGYQANSTDVHRFFHSLGAGSIEEVRVTRDKGFGFVRYITHDEAALAIQMGNGQLIGGRQIKVPLSDFPYSGDFL